MTWDGRTGPVAMASAGQSTNASGYFTLTHDLGYVPTWLDVTPNNSAYLARADLTTATTSTVLVYVRQATTGALVTSTAIGTFHWLAFP